VRIEWTETAEASVLAIADYISIDDPGAALAVHEEIHQQVARLADHPHMGRQGRCAGTRELVINRTPYIVAYRVERAAISFCGCCTRRDAGRRHSEAALSTLHMLPNIPPSVAFDALPP
jgi:toxin ParE1/3/4